MQALASSCRRTPWQRRQGGALKLVNATKRLKDLLVITKLATVFEMFDDEAAGLASFNK